MSNNGTWYIKYSSKINTLIFEDGSSVDFRYTNFDLTQERSLSNINLGNRITLQAETITGNNGTFALYGVLDRNAWGQDASGGIIATDKAVTSILAGTHNIKIFWSANQLDEGLLQANLYDDHIIVAEQTSTNGGGGFCWSKE